MQDDNFCPFFDNLNIHFPRLHPAAKEECNLVTLGWLHFLEPPLTAAAALCKVSELLYDPAEGNNAN